MAGGRVEKKGVGGGREGWEGSTPQVPQQKGCKGERQRRPKGGPARRDGRCGGSVLPCCSAPPPRLVPRRRDCDYGDPFRLPFAVLSARRRRQPQQLLHLFISLPTLSALMERGGCATRLLPVVPRARMLCSSRRGNSLSSWDREVGLVRPIHATPPRHIARRSVLRSKSCTYATVVASTCLARLHRVPPRLFCCSVYSAQRAFINSTYVIYIIHTYIHIYKYIN